MELKHICSVLRPHEKLLVSFEGNVFQSTPSSHHQIENLTNNHLECDTRAFFLVSQLVDQKPNWIIKSTDTDFIRGGFRQVTLVT